MRPKISGWEGRCLSRIYTMLEVIHRMTFGESIGEKTFWTERPGLFLRPISYFPEGEAYKVIGDGIDKNEEAFVISIQLLMACLDGGLHPLCLAPEFFL